jgi:phosphoglycerate kinase
MNLLQSHSSELTGQSIIVRCNFDVPLENQTVGDTTRIEDAIPTLKYLLSLHSSLILLAHAGRPDGTYQEKYSLAPVLKVLETLLHQPVSLIPYAPDYHNLPFNPSFPIQLLDNLRFYPEEEAHDLAFAQFLSSQAKVYVNEAFANCHRHHASMVELPQLFSANTYAGLSLEKELNALNRVTQNPAHPFVVVIGGAKLETKEPLVTALAPKADTILVGGKIALDLKSHANLPTNVVLADLVPDGKDITPESAQSFANIIMKAQTVMWNGTLGLFEDDNHKQGTQIVATAINSTPAYTLIGGGDTETALTQLNLESGIDYISTGGGAMLTYLSEGHLVALDALNSHS